MEFSVMFSVRCVKSTTVLSRAYQCNADEKKSIADCISSLENQSRYGHVSTIDCVDTTDDDGKEITSQIFVDIMNNHEYRRHFKIAVIRTARFEHGW